MGSWKRKTTNSSFHVSTLSWATVCPSGGWMLAGGGILHLLGRSQASRGALEVCDSLICPGIIMLP